MVNVSRPFAALCPNDGSATQALAPPVRSSKGSDMRDFRDAKAMAHTLRAALAAKGFKVTISQSLELIAEIFGAADWNTLAAAIRQGSAAPRATASAPPPSSAEPVPESSRTERPFPPVFSRELELTFHRAITDAD